MTRDLHVDEPPSPTRRLVFFLSGHDGLKFLASILLVVLALILATKVFGVEPHIFWLGMLAFVGILLMLIGLLGMWEERREEEEFFFDDHF